MTVGIATPRANAFLDSEYGTIYVKLHTGDPGAAGTSNASVGDATRKQATMAAAANGSKALTSMSGPWTNGGTSEIITHVSIWTAATAGTFLRSAALTGTKSWDSGDTLAISSLSFTLGPLAA